MTRKIGMQELAFDTETFRSGDRNEFLCGSFYDGEKYRFFTSPFEMIERMLRPSASGCRYWAHNLDFDFAVLTPVIESLGYGIIRAQNESRLIFADVVDGEKHTWRFCDTMNIYQGSLAAIGKTVGEAKGTPPSWLGERRPETEEEFQELKKYNLQDVRVLMKFLQIFSERFMNGGKVKPTLCGNALKYWCENYENQLSRTIKDGCMRRKVPFFINMFAKKGYFGGRCETFQVGRFKAENYGEINYYDVNSLYPFAQMNLEALPDIDEGYSWTHDVDFDRVGFADAIVMTDDPLYPLLPSRSGEKDENKRLTFKDGIQRGVWTFLELEELEKTGEGKIIKVYRSVSWKPHENYFREFIHDFYKKRMELKRAGDGMQNVYKIILNGAGYGKFGELHGTTSIMNRTALQFQKRQDGEELNEGYVRMTTPVKAMPHTIIPISAYITAASRIHMHRKLHEVEKKGKNVFYTDTDSLVTDATFKTSEEIGQFKLEMSACDAIFVRPKFYRILPMKEDEKPFVKCKGGDRRLSAGSFDALILKGDFTTESERFTKFLESVRRGKLYGSVEVRKKSFRLECDDKRIYEKRLKGAEFASKNAKSRALRGEA